MEDWEVYGAIAVILGALIVADWISQWWYEKRRRR
jgi:hypothetical protein